MDNSISDMCMKSANTNASTAKLVKAVFSFKGSNNDELCFNKDDIITLTRTPTGGWWEGTLNGITAWFPSNYCQPLPINDAIDGCTPLNINDTNSSDTDTQLYRNMVFQDIEDTETTYVRELQETLNKYLIPLQQSSIFPEIEINAVIRIIQDICSVHRRFLAVLDGLHTVSFKDSRIGGVFLDYATQIKSVHFDYCSIHSKFVHLIEKHKKEICLLFGTVNASEINAGNVQLITSLSSSFRRLEKYPALLQELQRYTDECHSDRGDTQRAGSVYREISMSCIHLRRQKEMELEVMLGNIKNWDGMSIQSLGEIIRMDSVSIQIIPDYSEMKKDRYLVLFPQILIILSVSNEMTSFVYESKIKLEDACINIADDLVNKTNIFEIAYTDESRAANNNYRFIIQCSTIDETNNWLELLQKYILHSQTLKHNSNIIHAYNNSITDINRSAISSNSDSSSVMSNIILNTTTPQRIGSTRSRYWSTRSLIPHPPTRFNNVITNSNASVGQFEKQNSSQSNTNAEDMLILQVIESYCSTGNQIRKTSNSVGSDTPQILVIDEDKSMSADDSSFNVDDRGLLETVNLLRDEIKHMKAEIKSLSEALRAEQRARRKLKTIINEKKEKNKIK